MTAPTTNRPPERTVVEERPVGSRWRTLLAIAVVAAVVVGGGWWVSRPTTYGGSDAVTTVSLPGAAVAPVVGDPAPDFTATTTTGESITLASLRGRPVWLTFGASWCAPCRVEAPDIQAAHAASTHGVQVVAVYLGEDAPTIQAFADALGLTYPHIPDPDRTLAAAWGVNGIPVHWFLDADGVVRATRVGIVGPEQIETVLGSLA
ncbi:MAG: TlpA disulfide reductase family protein [Propionibacteriaceae bacterium]|nr:TlpA disulfide reductase family protein [Propionibacteriaceae bacterium]